MATRFPTKLVITRVSPFVAFGAVARVFLATGLASINERPMQLTTWIVACLALFPWNRSRGDGSALYGARLQLRLR
jgi:hypothetical protein